MDGQVVFADGELQVNISVQERIPGVGGSGGAGGATGTGGTTQLRNEVVWEFPASSEPPVSVVETVLSLRSEPNTLLIATQPNSCAEASIWRATLDPVKSLPTSVTHVQRLPSGPTTRFELFESSTDGTLLTGGGWCGGRPAFYSVDHGASWSVAVSAGSGPGNSVFDYTEFNGSVYAGTGFYPTPGEVYRWTGNATWEQVFSFGTARNLISALAAFDGRLFVGGALYDTCSNCSTLTAVFVSADGRSFTATTGIPGCHHVYELFPMNGGFYALTQNCGGGSDFIYSWDPTSSTWSQYAEATGHRSDGQRLAQANGVLFGLAEGLRNISVSRDIGRTWETLPPAVPANGEIARVVAFGNIVYWTAFPGPDGVARIYRIVI